MTVRVSTNLHFNTGDVRHKYVAKGRMATLDIADFDNFVYLHFEHPGQIDEVIAELVALRAEMTGVCGDIAPNTGRPCTEAGEHERHRNGMVVWGPGVTEPVAVSA